MTKRRKRSQKKWRKLCQQLAPDVKDVIKGLIANAIFKLIETVVHRH